MFQVRKIQFGNAAFSSCCRTRSRGLLDVFLLYNCELGVVFKPEASLENYKSWISILISVNLWRNFIFHCDTKMANKRGLSRKELEDMKKKEDIEAAAEVIILLLKRNFLKKQ